MKSPPSALHALRQRRPEWVPWLAVIEELLQAMADAAWTVDVAVAAIAPSTPLLAGASIAMPAAAARRLLDRLIATASRGGTSEMSTLGGVLHSDVDLPLLISAAIARSRSAVDRLAARTGADPEALDAIAGLLTLPLLQACHRRWAATVPEGWTQPYCPMCGAWPVLAEVRGIERSRFFRCGRCGSEWHARMLACPYCAMDDHEQLVTLVPEQGGAAAVIDACRRCRGYVKVLTRLQGCKPELVMVEDIATVDLDLAAVTQGYTRPGGVGYAIHVTLSDLTSASGAFA